MVFVMFHFTMLNLTIFSSFLIYFPQPLTGPVIGVSLIVVPAIFLLVESVFHGIITNPYSDDLGYYGRFHRGVWTVLGGLLICCGGGGEDLGSAQPIQTSPPPYFYALAADTTEVLRDDEKIV